MDTHGALGTLRKTRCPGTPTSQALGGVTSTSSPSGGLALEQLPWLGQASMGDQQASARSWACRRAHGSGCVWRAPS